MRMRPVSADALVALKGNSDRHNSSSPRHHRPKLTRVTREAGPAFALVDSGAHHDSLTSLNFRLLLGTDIFGKLEMSAIKEKIIRAALICSMRSAKGYCGCLRAKAGAMPSGHRRRKQAAYRRYSSCGINSCAFAMHLRRTNP